MTRSAGGYRIALVYASHRQRGGAEQYLNQLARSLARLGHEITIVCRRHEDPPHPSVRFVHLPVPSPSNAWRMWSFARAVERHVRSADYDVVVGLGRTWSQDVIRCGGVHDTFLELERRYLLGPWERWRGKGLLKGWVAARIEERAYQPGRYRHVLVNSELLARDLIARHGISRDQISVIHNGVDLERFHPRLRATAGAALRSELGLADADPVLLFLGTGFARKGLRALLDAMPEVLRARPEARLLVVGTDKHDRGYREHGEALALGDRVRFLGRRSDPEACFAAADLYVLPTLYDSFAYSILEAMASGLPVVTTLNAGASELLDPREHGAVLEAPCAPPRLAEAVIEWSDPQRRAASAASLRRRAEQHSEERSMGETTALILEVARTLTAERAAARALPAGWAASGS